MTGTKIRWGQMTLSLSAVLLGLRGATESGLPAGARSALVLRCRRADVPTLPVLCVVVPLRRLPPGIFLEGAGWATGGSVAAAVMAIAGAMRRARQSAPVTTYGSPRWATEPEVRAAGLLKPAGIYIGRLGKQYLRHAGPEQVLCFAPTRSGKGVGASRADTTLLAVFGGRARHKRRELGIDRRLAVTVLALPVV